MRPSSRDPETSLDRILWLAGKAEDDPEAGHVLHDALLSAGDVILPDNIPRLRHGSLAQEYGAIVDIVERWARNDGKKWAILFSRGKLMRGMYQGLPISPFERREVRTFLPSYLKSQVVTYITHAGRGES